ncbi:MAG: WG repeat-containing protein [Prevotella sp.]|jgi:hypothetical protein|nr:WG repeat-containing protein [Prevotella sp.]
MKKALFSCLLSISVAGMCAQNILVFESQNKFGLKTADNKVIVKAIYDYVYPAAKKNYFLIEKNKKIGLIDKNGKVLFPPVYDDVQSFGEDNFLVLSNNNWGVIDKYNKVVVPVKYSGFEQINEYYYVIHSRDNKKGLINKFGNIVMLPKYDEISSFSENLLLVKNGNNVGIISNTGNVIIPDNYNSLEKLPGANLYKVSSQNKWGVIDLSGNVIVEPLLDEIDSSGKNYIIVKKDGKYGFIVNKKYVPARYDRIVFIQEEVGVIAVKEGKLNGFVTIYGLIVPPVYDNISRFSLSGYAFVEKRGKLMFVDMTGREHTLQGATGIGLIGMTEE